MSRTDAPPQLVELTQSKALGVLHDHHGGVGDVDADLDDGRGHQYLDLPGNEPAHDRVLFVTGHAAMQQSHPHR